MLDALRRWLGATARERALEVKVAYLERLNKDDTKAWENVVEHQRDRRLNAEKERDRFRDEAASLTSTMCELAAAKSATEKALQCALADRDALREKLAAAEARQADAVTRAMADEHECSRLVGLVEAHESNNRVLAGRLQQIRALTYFPGDEKTP